MRLEDGAGIVANVDMHTKGFGDAISGDVVMGGANAAAGKYMGVAVT